MEQTIRPSRSRIWIGRIISGLPALFLAIDAVMKLLKPPVVVQATIQLGYPESVITTLGVLLLLSTVLYLFPRTSVIGAILVTGYLGGAVASNLRVGNPLFSHVLFPVYVGALLWIGLALRQERVRAALST